METVARVDRDELVRAALHELRSAGLKSATPINPALLAALGVPEHLSGVAARDLVRRSLLSYSDRLSPRLRIAFLESAGFRREAPRGRATASRPRRSNCTSPGARRTG